MARLILVLLLVAAVLVMAQVVLRLLQPLEEVAPKPIARNGGNTLPDTFKNIAYALLIVLMFGVVTGWLGGL